MLGQRVIVLHSTSSTSNNVMVGARGSGSSKLDLSTFVQGSSELTVLRQNDHVKIEAPSFQVQLIAPVNTQSQRNTAAPALNWGVEAVGALSSPFDGRGVTVAVLDTGIDAGHAAFEGVEIIEEDFTGEGNGDPNGHGTHCAGTICGRDVDGTRIGVACGINRLLIGKVLGKNGGGATEGIFDAMIWALKNGAHIISMSLGMDFPGVQKALQDQGMPPQLATSMALQGYRENVRLFDRIAEMIEAGDFVGRRAIVVAATGNESKRSSQPKYTVAKGPPAAADGFLAVGAVKRAGDSNGDFEVADFSNIQADIAAPGVDIWSAQPGGGLISHSGTSMATPHVAGVAALWAEKSLQDNNGEVVISDVIDNLRYHTIRPSELARDDVGRGIVQSPT